MDTPEGAEEDLKSACKHCGNTIGEHSAMSAMCPTNTENENDMSGRWLSTRFEPIPTPPAASLVNETPEEPQIGQVYNSESFGEVKVIDIFQSPTTHKCVYEVECYVDHVRNEWLISAGELLYKDTNQIQF